MRRVKAWLPSGVLAALAAGVVLTPSGRAGEVGFVEDFALAADRAAALRQLVPGTEDSYYYHALHLLNTGQFDKVRGLTAPWRERFGQTARLTEIETRHALLTYEKDPKASLEYLRNRLGLHFDHQKETAGAAPNLPTFLDQELIAWDTLKADSFRRWQNLDNFEDTALDWLANWELTWERRRHLLQRLARPDVKNLPKLVADDLAAPHSPGFGAYPVHAQMTLPQLEELLKLRPELPQNAAFVRAWAAKLQPGADADWSRDRKVMRDYLTRLEAFVMPLPPVHNPFKAHVLFHRLALDRADDIYDKARFVEYLKLPRNQPYMARGWLERAESRTHPADLNADYGATTLLPPVRADEPLVRSYLQHFFLKADSPKEFEPYIDDTYLKHLFAETKVENGLGDPEVWASQLPPDHFAKLRDRVDIDFAFTNKTDFAADEPVRLDLYVKNVPTLLVKVFEINTSNYYRTQLKEVDTDVNLDGLVANAEETHRSDDPPLRRTAKRFEFPKLTKPGVYVIDFIGSGKSSRALVRKGRLRAVTGTGTAGQTVTVVDDAGKPVANASVWLGGREYKADQTGTAVVPFSSEPGRRPVVLSNGEFACLDHIDHQPEGYRLAAGIHVDRESLVSQKVAPVLVRPGLFLNGKPVSVKLLDEVKLRIVSTDHSGISSSVEVPDFKLFEDRESVHEFRVPPRLAALIVTLTAKVKSLSLNQQLDLSAGRSFALSGIAKTDKIEDLHLAKFGPNYVIELLGRTGEAKPDRPVQLALKHRDFKEPVRATLKTDPQGRVMLGPLADIVSVTATGPEGTAHTWPLPLDRHTYRAALHAKVGEVVTLPYLGDAGKPTREELALFEVRGDLILADRFDRLAVADGLLELRDLAAGDYDLWLKRTGERVRIRVTDGPVVKGHVLGTTRHLELPGLKPVHIAAVTADEKQLTVRLKDASKFARVHVLATRYLPAFRAFDDLAAVRDAGLAGVIPTRPESVYLTGRNIGDEYRYVLDRRGMKKYPGNMLERPQLLLNPWAVRSTETGEQQAQAGQDFAGRGQPAPTAALPPAPKSDANIAAAAGGDFADLDFLADPAAVLANLVPDDDGVIRIDRARLGPHNVVRVVAVDPLGTTARTVALPRPDAMFADLRLRDGLDPAKHFTQQKQVTVLAAGKPFVLADVTDSRFEAYDSLAKVYGLYSTLSHDPKLAEFAFLLTWPKLKPEEKRALYSKYACHELHFFLSKKDPKFFAEVVKPYLANKKDKTFLDHWLLGHDLGGYLDPWKYGRLNAVERVLLAKRVAGEPARTARHLDDLLRLQTPNPDRTLALFDTAVLGQALATEGALGVTVMRGRAKEEAEKARGGAALGFGAGGMPGAPGGGFGGRGNQPGPAGPALATPPPAAEPGALSADKKAEALDELKSRDGRTAGKDLATKRKAAELSKQQAQTEFYFEAERLGRRLEEVRQLYRKVDPTMEYAESNYYKLRIAEQVAGLVPPGPFWLDYVRHADGPFLSPNLADASRTFTEMMFALSVLDLPFEPAKHEVNFDGGRMTLTPAGPAVAFHEEVRPADAPDGAVPVLVGQNFYRHGDRFREENGEKMDKYVTGEFLVHTVYGGQVVVTNPTSARQRLTVLVQVPVGAIPLAGGQYTKSVLLDLEPYHTRTVDYLFYFPRPGKFAQFPAHVAKNEKVVAAAKPATFEVVEKLSKPDTTSWDYISQHGTDDEVIAMLERENVAALNLDKIAFRMRDKAFFERVVPLLKARHQYSPTLWSYALYHNAPAAAKEFLAHADQLAAEVGGPIDTPLFTLDPVARHQYEHLEYKPLVNARTHALGNRRQIVNGALHEQYHRLLKQLSYRPQLTDDDHLAVTYYLLLQDRVDEAVASFRKVHRDRVATQIQYDYCAAYLALCEEKPEVARSIAFRYAGHPVDRWRKAFAEVINHTNEAAEKGAQIADADDRGQRQDQLAATEPGFEVAVANRAVQLTWQNLEAVEVSYHPMDVELMFSRQPFAQATAGTVAFTKPASTMTLQLPAGRSKLAVPMPDELARRNVLVEVTAAGKTRAVPLFAAEMDVRLTEAYGQLKVTDPAAGRPLPKVYVKVYARLANGQVKFHKDGYTDLRGRFDYASVSTPLQQPVERFAVLVLSEDRGAVIREAAPPQQ